MLASCVSKVAIEQGNHDCIQKDLGEKSRASDEEGGHRHHRADDNSDHRSDEADDQATLSGYQGISIV